MTQPPATTKPKPRRKAGEGKRQLSERELAQRREAAKKSTGPRTVEGKAASSRNAWKHGLDSAVHKAHFENGLAPLLHATGKPCRTTCPKYPCALVDAGDTQAGGNCLDKQTYVQAFGAIIDAVSSRSMDGVHGLMAAEVASTLQMLHELKASVTELGPMIGIPMLTSEGEVVTRADGTEVMGKYVANPGWPLVLKTLEVLGISLPELLATPQSQARAKVEGEKVDAMQTALGSIFQRAGLAARPGRVIEHGEG